MKLKDVKKRIDDFFDNISAEELHGHTLIYWKKNAEKDYSKVPISVLKYITVLEEQTEQLRKHAVVGQSEQLVCDNHYVDLEHFMNYSESICKTCKQKV